MGTELGPVNGPKRYFGRHAWLSPKGARPGNTGHFWLFTADDAPVTQGCRAGKVGVSIRPMIKHVVMWKLRGTSLEEKREQAARVRAALEALRGNIPGMSSLE